tara:strand:+ start:154 stop:333 length:180 start_codon:yes stop_codon:yes gene_type:complete
MTRYSNLYYEAQYMRAARQREANHRAIRKAVGIALCIVVATPVTAACILYAILIAGGAS